MDRLSQEIDREQVERLWEELRIRQGQLRPLPRVDELLIPGDLVQFRESYCVAQGARWNPSVEEQSRIMRGVVTRKVNRLGVPLGTFAEIHWFTGDFDRVEDCRDLMKRGHKAK